MTTETNTAPLALVTGGSSGIGLSLARELVRRGYDVVIAAEDDELETAAADVRAAGRADGGAREVVPVQVDLSLPEGVAQLFDIATGLGRPLDVVALNAGVGVGGPFWESAVEEDMRLIDLNVRSTVHLAKLVVRDMVDRGSGRILVTSSIAAKAPGPYHSTYAASKAFVHSFAEGIRQELKGTGVTVTSLMPGPTDTEFFERADLEDTRLGQTSKDEPDDVARDGIEALLKGKDHVVAGSAKNRAMAAASAASPDQAAAKAMGKMAEPGSGD